MDDEIVEFLRSLFRQHDSWGRDDSEFNRVPTPNEKAELAAWVERTGRELPDSYRAASLRFGGFSFEGSVRPYLVNKSPIVTASRVGDFLVVFQEELSNDWLMVDGNIPSVLELFERSEYQTDVSSWRFDLVPVAGNPAFGFWCLDFRFDEQDPPVVYVDAETEWDGDVWSFRGVSYAAENFADFVGGIEYPDPSSGRYPTERRVAGERSERETRWVECRQQWLGLKGTL